MRANDSEQVWAWLVHVVCELDVESAKVREGGVPQEFGEVGNGIRGFLDSNVDCARGERALVKHVVCETQARSIHGRSVRQRRNTNLRYAPYLERNRPVANCDIRSEIDQGGLARQTDNVLDSYHSV
jgi:hypothetical protein